MKYDGVYRQQTNKQTNKQNKTNTNGLYFFSLYFKKQITDDEDDDLTF